MGTGGYALYYCNPNVVRVPIAVSRVCNASNLNAKWGCTGKPGLCRDAGGDSAIIIRSLGDGCGAVIIATTPSLRSRAHGNAPPAAVASGHSLTPTRTGRPLAVRSVAV